MSDSPQQQPPNNDNEPEPDPEIAALLDFEPVPRRNKRDDGWTAPLLRKFIAQLARTGSPGKACDALGKRRSGIDKLYKVAAAESFRAAWHKAVEIAERRAAERIEAEHRATAGLTPPFLDHRRKPDFAQPEPEEEQIGEDAKIELLQSLATKFLKKVVAERQARLNGEIVAADFYLRQITVLEVAFDMMSSDALGRDAWACLRELQRGGHSWAEIADTPFARYLDDKRREYWAANGEPMRPVAFREEFLEDHGSHRTQIEQHSYGALSTPARGYSAEEWAELDYEEQRRAREAQFEEDAGAQIAWEQQARAEFEANGPK